ILTPSFTAIASPTSGHGNPVPALLPASPELGEGERGTARRLCPLILAGIHLATSEANRPGRIDLGHPRQSTGFHSFRVPSTNANNAFVAGSSGRPRSSLILVW